MSKEQVSTVTLFYCYAHEDEPLRDELDKHLAAFKRLGHLTSWHDRYIQAGTEWQKEIELHLTSANLILLLISPDFIYSDACDEEMHKALVLHHAKKAQVIPILLRPVIWESTPIADLQLLPLDSKPITAWSNHDEAFRQVAYSIGNTVRTLLALPSLSLLATTSTPRDGEGQKSQEPSQPNLQTTITHSPVAQKPDPPRDVPPFEPRNPYKGLHAFTTEDATDFFGREHLISELVTTLQNVLSSQQSINAQRLLTVIGPSGSGKSSAVLAGLIPALQQGALPGSERWIFLAPLVPGPHPLEALARILSYQFPQRSLVSLQEDLTKPSGRGIHLLAAALAKGRDTPIILYIDQFEELFTQTLEETERTQFIKLLVTAITEPYGPLVAVISLRADFYDRPMNYPLLFRLMCATQVPVLPLDHRDLRDVIKKPSALPDVRLRFEDDLIGELLVEMRGQSGALPLLQFTMDRLFQSRQGQLLTLAAYHAMGGVQGALAQHAEAVYAWLPTEEHRSLTRALFLRLVDPGTLDRDPTRRRAALSELALADSAKAAILDEVTATFTSARLLTTTIQEGVAVVEVSHEAVIRGWARLAAWLREAHEDLYLQRRIHEDAEAWIRQGHPVVRLYRDEQLEEALIWKKRSLLSFNEEAFLGAGANEQARQKALLVERQRQEAGQHRRTRRLVLVGLAVLAVTTATSTLFILRSQSSPTPPPFYQGHTAAIDSVAWSPDGKHLASASADWSVQVWDATSKHTLLTYKEHTDAVNSVAWSPDGKHLASAGADQTVRVWDASSGYTLRVYKGHLSYVNGVTWSPDSKRIASASADQTIQVWDASSGHTFFTYKGHTSAVNGVAWSHNGQRLASAGADQTARVWDASSGQSLHVYKGHLSYVNGVTWSPDSKHLASASADQTVRVWDASSGQEVLKYLGHTAAVTSVAWSPDGKHLASAGADLSVQVWDASSGYILRVYRNHTALVRSVAWSPDGKYLASAGADQIVHVWDTSSGNST